MIYFTLKLCYISKTMPYFIHFSSSIALIIHFIFSIFQALLYSVCLMIIIYSIYHFPISIFNNIQMKTSISNSISLTFYFNFKLYWIFKYLIAFITWFFNYALSSNFNAFYFSIIDIFTTISISITLIYLFKYLFILISFNFS